MNSSIDFVHKPIVVVGLGVTGDSVLRLLRVNGVKKKDLITFDKSAAGAQYTDPAILAENCKPGTLVVSPGVPLASPWILEYQDQGVAITSELALAYHFLTTEKVICVTGSVGKSTVVSLLEAGLKSFSPTAFVGGNIGRPLADYVADLIEGKRERAEWIVLELSSFQLENLGNLQCKYSLFTSFTPNHLERYNSLSHYYETKWTLSERTTSCLVLDSNSQELVKFAKNRVGNREVIWTNQNDEHLREFHLEEAQLLGSHNQDNLALAARIALRAGWPKESIQAMKRFRGLPHRMENLGLLKGIVFVNDSKATTVQSVLTAAFGIYSQMDRKQALVLFIGGRDKNLPWEQLRDLQKIQKLRPVFFGECGAAAKDKSGLAFSHLFGEAPVFSKLADALKALPGLCASGDRVLLSPGGTSLDEFKNFEDRGSFFSKKIREMFS